MAILTVGIDLAKNVFVVHGVNESGHAELVRPAVSREQLNALVPALPPCAIGMEDRSEAHHVTDQLKVGLIADERRAPPHATFIRVRGSVHAT